MDLSHSPPALPSLPAPTNSGGTKLTADPALQLSPSVPCPGEGDQAVPQWCGPQGLQHDRRSPVSRPSAGKSLVHATHCQPPARPQASVSISTVTGRGPASLLLAACYWHSCPSGPSWVVEWLFPLTPQTSGTHPLAPKHEGLSPPGEKKA